VDVERLRPQGKDWNDDLRAKRVNAKTPTALCCRGKFMSLLVAQ